MFGLFKKKNPLEALESEYRSILEKAMHAQRNGDLKLYAALTEEAEEVMKKIEALKS